LKKSRDRSRLIAKRGNLLKRLQLTYENPPFHAELCAHGR
jgi:hypothetical protein